jgi:hypothetical protein
MFVSKKRHQEMLEALERRLELRIDRCREDYYALAQEHQELLDHLGLRVVSKPAMRVIQKQKG